MILLAVALVVLTLPAEPPPGGAAFPFKKDDRVAWVGSSSTNIGVWPRTMEFLLRTRHPELNLTFRKLSTGGGSFATGIEKYDVWTADYRPTLVFLNYGSNDAGAGEKGLPTFKENMTKLVGKVGDGGACVVLVTPQAADERKSGVEPAARRRLYAETMLNFGKEKGWAVVDVHHPLEELQKRGRMDDENYTILKDTIHLTDPGYVAWAFYLYDRLGPPPAESSATLTANGKVTATVGCAVADVQAGDSTLRFVRRDAVLPLLPPVALPPRAHVPLEKHSRYLLAVTDLAEGRYEVLVEGKPVGAADAAALGRGVNLNTLLLDSGRPAPWEPLARQLWEGKSVDQVGRTAWRFEVRRLDSPSRP
jgi:lysophospholipase L1-like esterase